MPAPPDRSEQELRLSASMRAAQEGDAEAYAGLLEEIAGAARSFIARRGGDADSHEDFVQEVLISIHKARHTYDPGRPFSPWMWAIVRRRYVDFVRRYVRTTAYQVPTGFPVETIAAHDPTDHAKRALLLKQALSQLPDVQRRAVELTKLEGKSVRDAATELGVSEASLRVSVHRARGRLYRILTKMGYENS